MNQSFGIQMNQKLLLFLPNYDMWDKVRQKSDKVRTKLDKVGIKLDKVGTKKSKVLFFAIFSGYGYIIGSARPKQEAINFSLSILIVCYFEEYQNGLQNECLQLSVFTFHVN